MVGHESLANLLTCLLAKQHKPRNGGARRRCQGQTIINRQPFALQPPANRERQRGLLMRLSVSAVRPQNWQADAGVEIMLETSRVARLCAPSPTGLHFEDAGGQ